ncbi:MAG TPA: pantoate--beta-alanine ligase [Actinomycetes bacterium]|nr:pantoate--beta-alanine ligase [Actinomycetes bacterium]
MRSTLTRPVVVGDRTELEAARAAQPGNVALVPTMGALHEGHRALIRAARAAADAVVVSIFVNPLQFGANEDLARYPRTFDADLEMCAVEGVDLVFAPSTSAIYPEQPIVTVSAGALGDVLEGAHRAGHFDGVLTVVLKLFHLTQPSLAFFGAKDAQQLVLIRRMVTDLDVPVQIVTVPTVREPDGLALSSRNRHLSPADRVAALAISRALRAGEEAAAGGAAAPAVWATAGKVLADEPAVDLDYVALVDPVRLVDLTADASGPALLAVAGRVGSTRLIDNVTVQLSPTRKRA